MQTVRSRLQPHIHDRSRLPPILCRRLFLCVEFLDCVNRQVSRRSSLHAFGVDDGGRIVRIIVIRAVDDEIVVLGPVAVGTDGEESAARIPLYPGTQGHQILKIAAVERKLVDRLVGERAA